MSPSEHIKKLGRRIHNQRVALREKWEIVDMRNQQCCYNPITGRWRDLAKKYAIEIQRLKKELEGA